MTRMNPGIWEKIQKNIQEAEQLAEQNKYDLSILKVRQTLEYMVKLQCDKAGIVEGLPDPMVRQLYQGQWISKTTAERYLKILAVANETEISKEANANKAAFVLKLMNQEIAESLGGAPARKPQRRSSEREEMLARAEARQHLERNGQRSQRDRQPSQSRQQSSSRSHTSAQSRSRKKQGRGALNPADLLKLLIPVVLIVVLIFLIRMLTPDETPTTETTTAAPTEVVTTEAPTTTPAPTEPETEAPPSYRTTDTLNVRQEPSTNSSRLGKLSPGTVIDFVGDYDDTWAIIMYNEQQAYVSKDYLEEVPQ